MNEGMFEVIFTLKLAVQFDYFQRYYIIIKFLSLIDRFDIFSAIIVVYTWS